MAEPRSLGYFDLFDDPDKYAQIGDRFLHMSADLLEMQQVVMK